MRSAVLQFDDPMALFEAAQDAVAAEDWAAVTALCDPVSLRVFKRSMLQQFAPQRAARAARALTVDDLLRNSPDMPREVAEYNAAQAAKHSDNTVWFRSQFPTIADIETLATMEPAAVFTAWLLGCSPRARLQLLIDQGHAPFTSVEELGADVLSPPRWTPLGVIPDGARMAHVIYRYATSHSNPLSMPDNPEWAAWYASLPEDERQFMAECSLAGGMFVNSQLCRRHDTDGWRLVAEEQFLRMNNSAFGLGSGDDGDDTED